MEKNFFSDIKIILLRNIEKMSKETILFFLGNLFFYFNCDIAAKGSLRANLIRLLGKNELGLISTNEFYKELAVLMNISFQKFTDHLKEEFVNEKIEPKKYIERQETKKKMENLENWIDKSTFSHFNYYHLTTRSLFNNYLLFRKSMKENNQNPAGFYLFQKAYKRAHVKKSKHQSLDHYHCKLEHHGRLRSLEKFKQIFLIKTELVNNKQTNLYNEFYFPFHKQELRFIFLKNNYKESNYLKVEAKFFFPKKKHSNKKEFI